MTVNILHGDCMEYMATLPDKAFELAICDPEYGFKSLAGSGRRKHGIATTN
jgi:DNA modification methylase